MINLKINNIPVSVEPGTTILEAARQLGINIPTLCYLKDINEIGACRICTVEVKNAKGLLPACVYPVNEGMEVFTNTKKVLDARKKNLELLLSVHHKECLSCPRSGSCEFQKLCNDYNITDEHYYDGAKNEYEIDDSAVHMIRDNSKCVLCRRCVAVCRKYQDCGVIGPNERGFATHIGTAFDQDLADVACVSCGQCITACPTGALQEKDSTDAVWAALSDPEKTVIVQTAPAVRVGLGEAFGLPMGTNVEGKMVAALRRIGFDKVFDTVFGADLTIMEEAHELVKRMQSGGTLPMITSCSPGWIKYCEYYFPEFIPNLSSCKSPQQMFGAIAKTWYAEKMGIDPKNMVVVSIMPCTAKKFEIGRDDQSAAGVPDVDYALTTRELAKMIKASGLDFNLLPDEEFDAPLGLGAGAGVIFGATGGVMEAALRTANDWLTGTDTPAEKLDFSAVRGTDGIKEATYTVGGTTLKVAVCSGLANAKKLLRAVKNGEADYQFIEIMACPGGCVNGGGQPFVPASVRNFEDVRAIRAKGLYKEDEALTIRKSHQNPSIIEIYKDFLGEPGSEKAHHLLHTSYVAREKY